MLGLFIGQLPGLSPPAGETPYLIFGAVARYTCIRTVYFLSIRGLMAWADNHQPGLLRQQLWLSTTNGGGLMEMYKGFPQLVGRIRWNLVNSYLRYVVLDSFCVCLALIAGACDSSGWLRFCFASRRLAESLSYASLVSIYGYQLIPQPLLNLVAFPGEAPEPSVIYDARRAMTPRQIDLEWTMSSFIGMFKYFIGIAFLRESTCAVHRSFDPTRLCCWTGVFWRMANVNSIPRLALAFGCKLGIWIRSRTHRGDVHSGTMYNTAYITMYLVSNLWHIVRQRYMGPYLQRQSRWEMQHLEVDRLDVLYRVVFEGCSDEQLQNIRRELQRTVGGNLPDRPLRIRNPAMGASESVPFPFSPYPSGKELLACLDRHDRLNQLAVTRVRANMTSASREECEGKTCCVCLSDFDHEFDFSVGVSRLKCGHFFCSPCIEQWLVKKDFCPVCKAMVLTARPKLLLFLHWAVQFAHCMMVSGPTALLCLGDTDFIDVFLFQAAKGWVVRNLRRMGSMLRLR